VAAAAVVAAPMIPTFARTEFKYYYEFHVSYSRIEHSVKSDCKFHNGEICNRKKKERHKDFLHCASMI
jgi:hypothetical protein